MIVGSEGVSYVSFVSLKGNTNNTNNNNVGTLLGSYPFVINIITYTL